MAFEKYLVLAAVLILAIAAPTLAAAAEEEEQLETFHLDESSARTFIQVNGSNIITTPNFVVGITLIGISLALLFGSAASAASVAAASSLAAGSMPPGKYKRSLPDSPLTFANGANILKSLSTIDQQFKNFDIADVECRKRIICEIHQEVAASGTKSRLGSFTDVVMDTLNGLSSEPADDKYPFMKQYLEAANHGKSQKECSQVYNTCEYSVKNVLRNFSF